jgi:hypothetical protein
MTDTWSPLVLAGLGAFHGLNPAMGWLFAVALGLHRGSRAVVFLSLVPISVGHAVSIAAVASLLVVAGVVVPQNVIRIATGILLLGWGAYHWRFGHRHRVRFGMQVGLAGLFVWSLLMATAHGAGLMLWPTLMPLCLPSGTGAMPASSLLAAGLAGVGVHTLAMLSVTAAISTIVYEWLGIEVLRRAWLNIDALWVAALAATGMLMLLDGF